MFFRKRRAEAERRRRRLQTLRDKRAREQAGRVARKSHSAVAYNVLALTGQVPFEFGGSALAESIGGNAGAGYWGLNIWVDPQGAIVGYGVPQSLRAGQLRHTNLCLRVRMDSRHVDLESSDLEAAMPTQLKVIRQTIERINAPSQTIHLD